MTSPHIMRAFNEELEKLRHLVAEMGGMAEIQLSEATRALSRRDSLLAEEIVLADQRIDALEGEIDALAVNIIARRQPVANDLREIIAALKIAQILERVGDYASNVAKRTTVLNQVPPIEIANSIPRMASLVQTLIRKALDAYLDRDADKAVMVWREDEEVDRFYDGIFRELLTHMMEDPRNITPSTHLLFMAKNVERMGDLATNIAELVYFLVHGEQLKGERPKGDLTSYARVEPHEDGAKE